MTSDKKTLYQEVVSSSKRNLMSLEGLADTPGETIIRNGLPPVLVDDPLVRKDLVITSHMGQTTVYMGKGTTLGKKDTTLPHRHTFTMKQTSTRTAQTSARTRHILF